jgi:hypothetical protein
MTYRVLHCGTGNAGALALRGVIAHPDLELVGVLAYSPDKVGRDAGALSGGEPVGVLATDDFDAVLGLQADCLCYMGDGLKYPEESVEAMCRFLAAGTNVVTTSVLGLVNPATARPELREPVEAACRAGSTTFFCNGADPGFASDLIPLTLLALMDDVEAVRIQEIINYGFYDQVETMRVLFGFGQPLDYEAPLFTSAGGGQARGGARGDPRDARSRRNGPRRRDRGRHHRGRYDRGHPLRRPGRRQRPARDRGRALHARRHRRRAAVAALRRR